MLAERVWGIVVSGSGQAELDLREQVLRIQQLEIDIRQKQQTLAYFRAQF